MRTVQPCTMIGAYAFEADRVPRDEFQIRMAALNGVMDAKGCKAMLIYGDAREHAELAYFTNFIPRHRWALALLPREGNARLLISMSSRDMPAQRLMTLIPDVMSAWTWDSAFDQWLAGLSSEGADIATVGFDLMRPALLASIEKSLSNRFRGVAADAEVAQRATRPRELSLVRDACAVVRAGAAAYLRAGRDGAGPESAALAGERAARGLAAQDVRTLVSFDDGRTLAPFSGAFAAKPSDSALLGYIAVKHRGYWAEAFVSAPHASSALLEHARAGLDAALGSARPGVIARDLHAAAVNPLGGAPLHPALSGSVGRRIGLSANTGGELRPDAGHTLQVGDIYALHVGTRDQRAGAIASAMVAITSTGCELLMRASE
jgi:Xaa-Pro aminopeptidase